MKTLLLEQPWATLVANGIVDTLQFNKQTDYRGRVLLYAKKTISQKEYVAFPIEWNNIIENHKIFGNLEDMYENEVFIGFADLIDVAKEQTDSIWSKGDNTNYKWHFTNAYVFERPFITHSVDSDSQNLLIDTHEIENIDSYPYHKAELKYPYHKENELVIPIEEESKLDDLLFKRDPYAHKKYPNNERIFDSIDFYDEYVQHVLLGNDFDCSKTLQVIRIVTPSRTVRFELIDFYIGALVDEDSTAQMQKSISQNMQVQQQCFVFVLGKAIDAIPSIADAHVLQKVSLEHIFEARAFYGLGTPKGSKMHVLKAKNEAGHSRSYVCITKGVSYKDNEDKFWQLIHVTPYKGVWHAFLMKYYWTYLPLSKDAKHNQRYYVYNTKDLQSLIEYNKIEKSIANFDVLAYDVAPRIKFIEERKKYIVSACYWSNYKGLVCCEVPITLSEEYQVTFGEEKEIILFSNGSLISN